MKRRGPPPKYPIHSLNVGERVHIPWPRDPATYRPLSLYPMKNAIAMYERRSGKEFATMTLQSGLLVVRVK